MVTVGEGFVREDVINQDCDGECRHRCSFGLRELSLKTTLLVPKRDKLMNHEI